MGAAQWGQRQVEGITVRRSGGKKVREGRQARATQPTKKRGHSLGTSDSSARSARSEPSTSFHVEPFGARKVLVNPFFPSRPRSARLENGWKLLCGLCLERASRGMVEQGQVYRIMMPWIPNLWITNLKGDKIIFEDLVIFARTGNF